MCVRVLTCTSVWFCVRLCTCQKLSCRLVDRHPKSGACADYRSLCTQWFAVHASMNPASHLSRHSQTDSSCSLSSLCDNFLRFVLFRVVSGPRWCIEGRARLFFLLLLTVHVHVWTSGAQARICMPRVLEGALVFDVPHDVCVRGRL